MPPERRGPVASSLRALPRRFQVAFALSCVFVLLIIVSIVTSDAAPTIPSVSDVKETAQQAASLIHRPDLPQLWNPFAENAHEPLEQANSTRGDSRWYSDLKWLNPFSWKVTLDAERTLLPLVPPRTPVYTYYTAAKDDDRDLIAAENGLILQWRRAWWAQGFRPIVLGHAEAAKHPSFKKLEGMELDPKMLRDLERWMAWSHMNGGVVSNWLVFPMAPYDDAAIERLRNRDYEKIRRFKSLKGGLLGGKKTDIDAAIEEALAQDPAKLKKYTNMNEALSSKVFEVESKDRGLAFYDSYAIATSYKRVMEDITMSEPDGLRSLGQLINSHLHSTWQSTFSDGIAVLTPHSQHLGTLAKPALKIAERLAQCPESPMPQSCPPNSPSCKPCSSKKPLKLASSERYVNKTKLFTIGTAQHPYTYNTLRYMQDELDVRFIRRNTTRDQWLINITTEVLGDKLSGSQRLIALKEIIAAPQHSWRSLWLTGEQDSSEPRDLDFFFGFSLPLLGEDSKSVVVVGAEGDASELYASDQKREQALIEHSQKVLSAKSGKEHKIADAVTAWNLADTEAWRFVKAFGARRIVERLRWEEEERRFAGAEKNLGWFEKPKAGE